MNTSREWFQFVAADAEAIGVHPETRTAVGRQLLIDMVDRFAGVDRPEALAAFDVLVEVTDRALTEHDPAERAVLSGEVQDALRVLVPDSPRLRVVS